MHETEEAQLQIFYIPAKFEVVNVVALQLMQEIQLAPRQLLVYSDRF